MTTLTVRGFNDHCRMAFRAQVIDHSFSQIAVAQPVDLVFSRVQQNELVESTFTWDYEFAQALFQAMWDAGYRPDDGSAGSEERAALKDHIKFAEHVSRSLLDTNVHRIASDIARSMK